VDDGPPRGRRAQPRQRFIHTDVISAYSQWCSPSTPDDYVRALARQYPKGPDTDNLPRPALAIVDYGTPRSRPAVACDRAGVDHIVGLRVRVVPQRTKSTFLRCTGEARTPTLFRRLWKAERSRPQWRVTGLAVTSILGSDSTETRTGMLNDGVFSLWRGQSSGSQVLQWLRSRTECCLR